MPKPKAGESQDDFISRCIAEIMPAETTDEKQAYAICKSKWNERFKKESNYDIVCKRLKLK